MRPRRREDKHVIYIQFDNVHFTRDNPRVPSDLEQMLLRTADGLLAQAAAAA